MLGRRKEKEPEIKRGNDQTSVTKIVRESLESIELKYSYDSTYNVFKIIFNNDDLFVTMNIFIDECSLRFVSYLDVTTREDKLKDVALELSKINSKILFGVFYIDPNDSEITFDYSFPYLEADVKKDFVLDFLDLLTDTVFKYIEDLKKLAES